MNYIIGLLIVLGTAINFTLTKWIDGKIIQKRTGKTSEELKNKKMVSNKFYLWFNNWITIQKEYECV